MTNAMHKFFHCVAVTAVLAASACVAEAPQEAAEAEEARLVVYHDPNCGCCSQWIEHMEANGFEVQSIQDANINAVKQRLGVPADLPACHTATIGDYVIEGHVPAADVRKLLEQQPDARGLSVPGMPLGSPGMEHNGQRQAYDVVLFDESGAVSVFTHYPERRN